ncbi:MAG: methyltransferase domain-containing protein [Acidimicrobiia bacterium]|nr:methyltransferase domain-containing protein [Acidimicrobiia bacterium]
MSDESPWPKFKSEVYSFFGRNPRSNRQIDAAADLHKAQSVLDIGCGPGAAVRAAAYVVKEATGVDRSEAMIDIARRRSKSHNNVSFVVAGAEELPFPDGSFDRIWTIHAFHHWEDPAGGIAESLRVLRPGGRFLVIESETKGKHGLSRSGAETLAGRLRAAGFAEATVSKQYKQLIVTGIAP